eukprot:symbB.v1.2.039424.t1/scaffold6555.1/size17125/2
MFDLSDCVNVMPGETCSIYCVPPYKQDQVQNATCIAENTDPLQPIEWEAGRCDLAWEDCVDPLPLPIGYEKKSDGFHCAAGYVGVVEVSPTVHCGPWHPNCDSTPKLTGCFPLESCRPVRFHDDCSYNTSLCPDTFLPGDECEVLCKAPYVGNPSVARCSSRNIEWQGAFEWTPAQCVCPNPRTVPEGYFLNTSGWFCDTNNSFEGSAQVVCSQPGFCLSEPMLVGCQKAGPCVAPLLDHCVFDASSCEGVEISQQCVISCAAGYIGPSTTAFCENPGGQFGLQYTEPLCQLDFCPDPDVMPGYAQESQEECRTCRKCRKLSEWRDWMMSDAFLAAMSRVDRCSPRSLLFLGAALRLTLILVAEVQDHFAEVPYTDIDYQVFTDAAESVLLGESPYEGRTALLAAEPTRFRYTPFLAYLLLPNVWIHKAWGKLLFSALDLVIGVLLQSRGSFALALWLFNPFCFTISTRGSGESVVALLIHGMIYFLHKQNWRSAAVIFGIAVHWRIYPVIYVPVIALHLSWQKFIGFGAVSLTTFASLGLICYGLYGMEFLECAYLHHGKRRDPQHNFSVYFYLVGYFEHDIARFAAIPQLLLSTSLGIWSQLSTKAPLPVAFLLQTLAFVATNKVLTAQYFVWWLCLLPAVPATKGVLRSLLIWMVAEVHWLLWAYFLEFKGLPLRPVVWIAARIQNFPR